MLGRVLGGQSAVHTFGELHFFESFADSKTVSSRPEWDRERLIQMLQRMLTSSRHNIFHDVMPDKYRVDAEEILANANTADPVTAYEFFLDFETRNAGKLIPCEQTPRYLYFSEEILEAFSESFVINMVRDPRDILLSQKNKWRRRSLGATGVPLIEVVRSWVNYHPYTISKLWSSAVRIAARQSEHPRFIQISFESLLSDPEETIKSICNFVGIKYESTMLNVPQAGSSTRADQTDKIGIDASRIGAWKRGGLTTTEVSICEGVCGNDMIKLGYELESQGTHRLRKGFSFFSFFLKSIFALLLNLNRTKNLRETLLKRLFT